MYRMQQVTRIEISKTFTGNHQNAQREVEYRTRLSQLLSSDICSISFSSGCVGVCFGVLCLRFALCSLLFSPHFSPFSSLSYKGLASLHFVCLLLLSEKGVRWALGGGKSTHTDTKKKRKDVPHISGELGKNASRGCQWRGAKQSSGVAPEQWAVENYPHLQRNYHPQKCSMCDELQ